MRNKTKANKKSPQERIIDLKWELAMKNPLFIELQKLNYCISMDIAKASVLGDIETERKLRIQLELVRTLKRQYLQSLDFPSKCIK